MSLREQVICVVDFGKIIWFSILFVFSLLPLSHGLFSQHLL
jgi:hypothetical protein